MDLLRLSATFPFFLPNYMGVVSMTFQNHKSIPITITNVIETTPHIVMQKKGKVAESRRRSIMNIHIYIN